MSFFYLNRSNLSQNCLFIQYLGYNIAPRQCEQIGRIFAQLITEIAQSFSKEKLDINFGKQKIGLLFEQVFFSNLSGHPGPRGKFLNEFFLDYRKKSCILRKDDA
jgi:hypothetical protein